ncbi:MAG: hypothetical protein AB1758_38310, partial [Candidatus Eremiobacterota bacterium]
MSLLSTLRVSIDLIPGDLRGRVLLLLPLMLLSAVLELLSVGSVLPLAVTLFDPAHLSSGPLAPLYAALGSPSRPHFALAFAAGALILYLAWMGLEALTTWLNLRLGAELRHRLSDGLLRRLLA